MHYKAYPTKKNMPGRMSRKRLRQDVFMANKKAAKARRKAARMERKLLVDENDTN